MSIKRLVVIVGPTGCGKTALSIRLAEHFRAPIISTDSRQFYKGMPIGTAQPDAEQLAAAKHHFIADREPTDDLSAGGYEREALERLESLFERHEVVVAVGAFLNNIEPEVYFCVRECYHLFLYLFAKILLIFKSITSFGPLPCKHSIVSSISRKFPVLYPSGVFIFVIRAEAFLPIA